MHLMLNCHACTAPPQSSGHTQLAQWKALADEKEARLAAQAEKVGWVAVHAAATEQGWRLPACGSAQVGPTLQ